MIKKIIFFLFLSIFNVNIFAKNIYILNVSYDSTRELYEQYNQAFVKHYEIKNNDKITIYQSHGGSAKQATSVINGIKSDVVTLALAYDIDLIANKGRLDKNWMNRLPYNSAPYTSTIVFLVRKDNPKNIQDWSDLIKPNISIITPNPKSSGGARWNYLAAWGYALDKNHGNQEQAQKFMTKMLNNVTVQDFGARNATSTFFDKGIGDVLISWENEAYYAINKLGKENYKIIIPSISILAEPSVSIVDKIVDRKNTREISNEYLIYLYSSVGQEIIAKNYFRPRNISMIKKYSYQFKNLKLFTIDDKFGGWLKVHNQHFIEGGMYDKIMKQITSNY